MADMPDWYFVVLNGALAALAISVLLLAAYFLDRLTGWFGDTGPMYSGNRKHRRYLATLARSVESDADHVEALLALTETDRAWLSDKGWQEPKHVSYARLNA